MELLLIRHGETGRPTEENHREYPLSPRGREQALLLAERLADSPPDHLYSSPILRARETAEIVARRLGKDVLWEPGFREIDVGAFGELPRDQRRQRFSQLSQQDGGPLPDFSPFQGEGAQAFGLRVAAAIQQLLLVRHANTEERVAVITHGGFINAALYFFVGAPFVGAIPFHLENTSLTAIRVKGERHRVMRVSDFTHLQPLSAAADTTPGAQEPNTVGR